MTFPELTRRARIVYALAFVLPLLTAFFVACSVSNVPIYDEWLWAPLVIAAHTGHLQPAQVWAQQNSHRSVVPTALALGLAALSGWDTRVETLLSVLLVALSQLCVLRLFVRERGAERAALPFLAASVLLYSLAQVENFLWGFQLSWFVVNALVLAMLVALSGNAPRPSDPLRFAAALCCAAAATFSMLFGFAAWPAGAVLLVRGPAIRRSAALVLWTLAAVACAVAYAQGYHRPPDEHGWFAEAASPWLDLPQFALAVLGSPLGLAGGRWLCELLGLGLCVAFGMLTARATRRGVYDAWSGLFVFAVIVAVLTAFGRTAYGVDAAVISRYTTPATLGWIALVGRASALVRIPRFVVIAAAALFAVTNVTGLFVSWQIAGEERDLSVRIQNIDVASDAELRRAFTNNYRLDQPGFIRAQTRELKALSLGPFRSPAAGEGRPAAPATYVAALPRPVVVATAQPQILAVAFEAPPYRWGELLHVRVVTTTNTGAVEVTPFADLPVRLPFRLHETSLGQFSGLLRIPFGPPGWRPPRLPFVVTVTAIGAEGRTVTRRLSFELAP